MSTSTDIVATVNGARIEKMDAEEVASFYPVKRYAVHYPVGKCDAYGATVKFCATKREAVEAARHSYQLGEQP